MNVGQLLFVGFDGKEMTSDLAAFLGRIRPGGIILFQRNIADPDQAIRLIAALKQVCDPAPLVAVDEEGGQVSRLRGVAPALPAAARLAALDDAAALRRMAASMGRILASAGFDLDFAPVVDLCRPDSPNGIGDRSFGMDPGLVCANAAAYLEGLADAGMQGCLKHFPGLGPTLFDSHHHLPTVMKEERAFMAEDLLPYHRLHSRAPVVMVGHGHYPFLAGPDPVAATLASGIVTDLLRAEVGFRGLALADDLEMKAVSQRISFAELAPRVIAAGCDMALVCRKPEAIRDSYEALISWTESGKLPASRVAEALSRVAALRVTVQAARKSAAPSVASFQSACAELSGRLEAVA